MIKKIAVLALGMTVGLVAADFWTKAYTDWNEKELQSMIGDSPWADRMAVETGQRGKIGNADDKGGMMDGNLTTPIVIVWRTALPVRQALARLQYGAEAATNPQGKALLENEQPASVLLLSLIPGSFRGDVADIAKLTADTTIKVKGKPDIHPTEIQIPPAAAPAGKGGPGGRGGGGTFDLILLFPKNAGLTVDDKELDFSTRVGKMSIRKKFKLKDMVYNGKLEM
jgi:hypothetical protein